MKEEKKSGKNIAVVHFVLLIAVIGVVIFNQVQINSVSSSGVFGKSSNPIKKTLSQATSLFAGGNSKGGKIIGPMLNSDGRTTKLVEWPTISKTPAPPNTGDVTQDAIKYIIPTGIPSYVEEGPGSELLEGITFDEPIVSQKLWAAFLGSRRFGTEKTIELTPDEQARWDKMVNAFTCDYCCGGQNSVTRIAHCGCAHSYAWQGMAKFFIRY